jgi:hypothetical protein
MNGTTPGGSIPLQKGEIDHHSHTDEFERPLSAPPPPGFGSGLEERNRIASSLFWPQPAAQQENPHAQSQKTASTSSSKDGTDTDSGKRRTSSFSNLAAVLGTGLAQSMEDATHEAAQQQLHLQHHHEALLNNSNKDDLNLHRQTRHAASRLIGASPPNYGDLLLRAPTGNHALGGAPASLFDSRLYTKSTNPTTKTSPSSSLAQAAAAGGSRHLSSHDGTAMSSFGFPTSLSNPSPSVDFSGDRQHLLHNHTKDAPMEMFSGHNAARRAKEIVTDLSEPENESQYTSGHRSLPSKLNHNNGTNHNSGIPELEEHMSGLWSTNAREFKPSNFNDGASAASSISDTVGAGTEVSARQAESELRPYLWDVDRNRSSRTLAVLHSSWLRTPDVRNACETFGVLESFRADFSTKGIFFVSYYDIRSAQYAAIELQPILQRLAVVQGSSDEVMVRYCLPLNASSQFDESQVNIHDLPDEVDEHALTHMLSSYGAVRSIIPQGEGSFVVEFQNVQDAKQALLEMESSQPYGSNVTVEVGLRNPTERKRGRELLTVISRWRHGSRNTSNISGVGAAQKYTSMQQQSSCSSSDRWRPLSVNSGASLPGMSADRTFGGGGAYGRAQEVPTSTTQLILGQDGRYMQVVVQNPPFPGMDHRQAPHQQIVHGPNGQIYITSVPQMGHQGGPVYLQSQHQAFPGEMAAKSGYTDGPRRQNGSVSSHYSGHYISDANSASGLSGRSHRSSHSASEDKDNRHLTMDLDAVEVGHDTRTSLMVRNIPNKYTQQMLLTEFMDNGHGPGVIDFFYLPIDFKNRCNRGYAFINFVDFKDILPFHRRYFGKHWRTFNSDKICDITYARIQGKGAMLKRFENSALMEKDDEYKPLVFVSDGPEKGQRLPFPDPNKLT